MCGELCIDVINLFCVLFSSVEDTKLNKIVVVIFKMLRFVPLAAPLWFLYNTLKKGQSLPSCD